MTDTAKNVSGRNFHRRMRRRCGSVSRTVLLVAKRRSCNPVVFASLARRPGPVSSVSKSMWPHQRGHAHHARPCAVAWEQHEHAWQCGACLVFQSSNAPRGSASSAFNVHANIAAKTTLRWARSTNAARRNVELSFLSVSCVTLPLEAKSPYNARVAGICVAVCASGVTIMRKPIETSSVGVRIASRPHFVKNARCLLHQTCCQFLAVMHVTSLLYGAPSMLLRHSYGRDYVRITLRSTPSNANTANLQKTLLASSSGDRVGHQVVSGRFVSAAIVSSNLAKIPSCASAVGKTMGIYVSDVTRSLPKGD